MGNITLSTFSSSYGIIIALDILSHWTTITQLNYPTLLGFCYSEYLVSHFDFDILKEEIVL